MTYMPSFSFLLLPFFSLFSQLLLSLLLQLEWEQYHVLMQILLSWSFFLPAPARIGHFMETQILKAIGIDYVDESEVLTLADDENHINKHNFRIPFVCGCRNLGEALRRIREGAAMIRTKGEAGTGNIIEAVRHVRSVMGDIRALRTMDDDEVFTFSKKIGAPYDLVMQTKQLGRLPVVHFAAGGVATPADAALMMQLGCDGVFKGSGVFKSSDPSKRASGIVQAVTHYSDPEIWEQGEKREKGKSMDENEGIYVILHLGLIAMESYVTLKL